MSWLQVEITVTAEQLTIVEVLFEGFGAAAITLVSDANEPVLEPLPGETPLWSEVRLQALFTPDLDIKKLHAELLTVLPKVGTKDSFGHHLDVKFVGEQDWQEAAKTYAVSQVFAERLWLLPKSKNSVDLPLDQIGADADPQVGLELDAEVQAGLQFGPKLSVGGSHRQGVPLTRLYLEPGLAFGSGSHPTTHLCLQWIARHVESGQQLLDFGCGSGILGIAGALLGAKVVAVDYDEQAVISTLENRDYNGLTHENLTTVDLSTWYATGNQHKFDVVVANILAAPLQDLADEFENVAKSGAFIVLSGVLAEQAESVVASYRRTQFAPAVELEGWVCLIGCVQHA